MIRLVAQAVEMRKTYLKSPVSSRPRTTEFYGIFFLCLICLIFIGFGVLPAALSPENAFRRMIIVPLGLDIVRGFALYGIFSWSATRLPVVLGGLLIATSVVGFSTWQWNAFFYGSGSHESNSTNSLTESVKAVSAQFSKTGRVVILAPRLPGTLSPESINTFIRFDFGFPVELPQGIRIISIEDLAQEDFRDVIVPADTLAILQSQPDRVPPGVQLSNIRESKNPAGKTFAFVDFQRASPAAP
jgi:hypothetical protein